MGPGKPETHLDRKPSIQHDKSEHGGVRILSQKPRHEKKTAFSNSSAKKREGGTLVRQNGLRLSGVMRGRVLME